MLKQKRTQDQSSMEEDPSPSHQQRRHLTPNEIKKLGNDCVFYLLVADQKKYPVKRVDIVKNVLKDHSREFKQVIQHAKEVLQNVFGIRLVELEGKKGCYILVNALAVPDTIAPAMSGSNLENAYKGILMIILSHIFMNGNVVPEKLMWQFLKKIDLDPDATKPHNLLGDIKKLLTQEFVKQGYLEYNRVPGTDPPTNEFRAGPRAQLEISKYELLQFFCHIYGEGTKPEMWHAQYREAMEEDQTSV